MNDSNISNISNLSMNNASQRRTLNDRSSDRNAFSSLKVEKNRMRIPNLNFSKLKNNAPKNLNPGNLGPKTSRDILRNKINTINPSKSNNKLNESNLNNSVNDVKSISNRSHLNNKPQRGNVSDQNKNYKLMSSGS